MVAVGNRLSYISESFPFLGVPSEILPKVDLEAVLSRKGKEEKGEEEEEEEELKEEEDGGELVQEEEKDTGVVKLDVYKSYWSAVGNCLSPLVLLSLLLMQGNKHH